LNFNSTGDSLCHVKTNTKESVFVTMNEQIDHERTDFLSDNLLN